MCGGACCSHAHSSDDLTVDDLTVARRGAAEVGAGAHHAVLLQGEEGEEEGRRQ